MNQKLDANNLIKKIKLIPVFTIYIIEFIFIVNLLLITRLIPFRISSFIFGNLLGKIFYHTSFSSRIKNNLRKIYPLSEESFINSMTKKIWINAMRFIAETSHCLGFGVSLLRKNVKFTNEEHLLDLVKKGKSSIILTSHIGNWWFLGKFFKLHKMSVSSFYRSTKNPFTRFIFKAGSMELIEKNHMNPAKVGKIIKSKGKSLLIFQDHREFGGEKLKLLGQDAMTAVFFAKIATKHQIPVIYTSCIRNKIKPTKFNMTFQKIYDPESDKNIEFFELAQKANDVISADIEANKEQWFWLHKRWKM